MSSIKRVCRSQLQFTSVMVSHKSLILLFLVAIAFLVTCTNAAGEDEDFVPDFFSGRRNVGDHAGMDPPPTKMAMTRRRSMNNVTNVKVMKFRQKLNHENKTCLKSFEQSYLVNDAHFNPNRSRQIIFIRVGGESRVNKTDLLYGRMFELAKRHRALILELEHRYYGETKPTKNLDTPNLELLTYKQAIEDLEAFIQYIRRKYGKEGRRPRIVLYGCSYADYRQHTFRAIDAIDPTCAETLMDAVNSAVWQTTIIPHICEPRYLLNTGLVDHKGIILPRLWEEISIKYDIFYQVMSIVQYNRKSSGDHSGIQQMCKLLKNESFGNVTTRYFEWLRTMGQDCVRHDGRVVVSKNSDWNSTLAKSGTRQWLYQMCTQFGYFTGGWIEGSMTDMQAIEKICNDSFSLYSSNTPSYAFYHDDHAYDMLLRPSGEAIWHLLNQTSPSKIIFIHGLQDPWFGMGVGSMYGFVHWYPLDLNRPPPSRGDVLNSTYVLERDILIKYPKWSSHCEEPAGNDSDYPDLVEAYEETDRKITSWISAI